MTKPYAWVDGNSRIQLKQIDPLVDIPLYTKQEWQRLTDIEINAGMDRTVLPIEMQQAFGAGVRYAEAKLKEKNGG